jgi:hypothetical protein
VRACGRPSGKATWPSYWEDEELRSAFAIDLAQTGTCTLRSCCSFGSEPLTPLGASEQTSMHVALAALRLHQSLRPHLTDRQEAAPPPPEAAAQDGHGHRREIATAAVSVTSRPSTDRGTSTTNTSPAAAMELSPLIESAAKGASPAATTPAPKPAARASAPKATIGVKRPARDAGEEELGEGEEQEESRARPVTKPKPVELALRPPTPAKKARKEYVSHPSTLRALVRAWTRPDPSRHVWCGTSASTSSASRSYRTLILQRPFAAGGLCAAQTDWRAPVLSTDLASIELLGSVSQSQSHQCAAAGPPTTLPASSNPFLPRAPSRKLLNK